MDEALSYTLAQPITPIDEPEISLLQTEESQLLLIQQILQSLYPLHAGLFPWSPCLSCTGHAVLQTIVTQVQNGGGESLALTYGHCNSCYPGWYLPSFLWRCTAGDQLVVNQDPSGLLCRASFQQVGPWCIWCLCLFFSTVLFRTLHFSLLKFMRFLLSQFSTLSRSHMVAQLCGVSAAPPSFASSENLVRCSLSHHFRSLVKLLNSINPTNEPWITPLVTCLRLDFVLLITTRQAWPFSQFSSCVVI